MLQKALVEFLQARSFPCSTAVPPHQPFLLDAWQALSFATTDVDAELPQLLKEGVPTGNLKPIAPPQVWDKADDCDFELDHALLVHTSPWKSAGENLQLARSLMMQDVEAGFAYILAGGIEEAKRNGGQMWQRAVVLPRLGGLHLTWPMSYLHHGWQVGTLDREALLGAITLTMLPPLQLGL